MLWFNDVGNMGHSFFQCQMQKKVADSCHRSKLANDLMMFHMQVTIATIFITTPSLVQVRLVTCLSFFFLIVLD